MNCLQFQVSSIENENGYFETIQTHLHPSNQLNEIILNMVHNYNDKHININHHVHDKSTSMFELYFRYGNNSNMCNINFSKIKSINNVGTSISNCNSTSNCNSNSNSQFDVHDRQCQIGKCLVTAHTILEQIFQKQHNSYSVPENNYGYNYTCNSNNGNNIKILDPRQTVATASVFVNVEDTNHDNAKHYTQNVTEIKDNDCDRPRCIYFIINATIANGDASDNFWKNGIVDIVSNHIDQLNDKDLFGICVFDNTHITHFNLNLNNNNHNNSNESGNKTTNSTSNAVTVKSQPIGIATTAKTYHPTTKDISRMKSTSMSMESSSNCDNVFDNNDNYNTSSTAIEIVLDHDSSCSNYNHTHTNINNINGGTGTPAHLRPRARVDKNEPVLCARSVNQQQQSMQAGLQTLVRNWFSNKQAKSWQNTKANSKRKKDVDNGHQLIQVLITTLHLIEKTVTNKNVFKQIITINNGDTCWQDNKRDKPQIQCENDHEQKQYLNRDDDCSKPIPQMTKLFQMSTDEIIHKFLSGKNTNTQSNTIKTLNSSKRDQMENKVTVSAHNLRNTTIVEPKSEAAHIDLINEVYRLYSNSCDNSNDTKSYSTRIYTVGIGDKVNSLFLQCLSQITRGISTTCNDSNLFAFKFYNFLKSIERPLITFDGLKSNDILHLKYNSNVGDIDKNVLIFPDLPKDIYNGYPRICKAYINQTKLKHFNSGAITSINVNLNKSGAIKSWINTNSMKEDKNENRNKEWSTNLLIGTEIEYWHAKYWYSLKNGCSQSELNKIGDIVTYLSNRSGVSSYFTRQIMYSISSDNRYYGDKINVTENRNKDTNGKVIMQTQTQKQKQIQIQKQVQNVFKTVGIACLYNQVARIDLCHNHRHDNDDDNVKHLNLLQTGANVNNNLSASSNNTNISMSNQLIFNKNNIVLLSDLNRMYFKTSTIAHNGENVSGNSNINGDFMHGNENTNINTNRDSGKDIIVQVIDTISNDDHRTCVCFDTLLNILCCSCDVECTNWCDSSASEDDEEDDDDYDQDQDEDYCIIL